MIIWVNIRVDSCETIFLGLFTIEIPAISVFRWVLDFWPTPRRDPKVVPRQLHENYCNISYWLKLDLYHRYIMVYPYIYTYIYITIRSLDTNFANYGSPPCRHHMPPFPRPIWRADFGRPTWPFPTRPRRWSCGSSTHYSPICSIHVWGTFQ